MYWFGGTSVYTFKYYINIYDALYPYNTMIDTHYITKVQIQIYILDCPCNILFFLLDNLPMSNAYQADETHRLARLITKSKKYILIYNSERQNGTLNALHMTNVYHTSIFMPQYHLHNNFKQALYSTMRVVY